MPMRVIEDDFPVDREAILECLEPNSSEFAFSEVAYVDTYIDGCFKIGGPAVVLTVLRLACVVQENNACSKIRKLPQPTHKASHGVGAILVAFEERTRRVDDD